jgi:hypothetical protein
MSRPFLSLNAFICATLAALATAVCAGDAVPVVLNADEAEAHEVTALIGELDDWLSLEGSYPPADRPLAGLVFAFAGDPVDHEGETVDLMSEMRGLYNAAEAVIYLARPWSAASVRDRSVLLHELVHHRQVAARHWYCPQAMEWDAYRLQEDWLTEHGVDPGFSWIYIHMLSSCTRRDHHPD